MTDSVKKLARILRVSPELLFELDKKMSAITGQEGVLDSVVKQNDEMVDLALAELGLGQDNTAEEIYNALIRRVSVFDKRLFDLLDKPDLSKLSMVCGKLCEIAFQVFPPPRGLFIKRERVADLLEKYRPENLLTHFGCKTAGELIEKEGFASVVSALRFVESNDWMHKFFDTAYGELKKEDFEEREVEIKILEPKWLNAAEKFLEKKYHNVSHLKEYGIIYIIPIKIDTPGEIVRMFSLMLHYLHEVPFYSSLFRRFFDDADFIVKFKSLLRGDVASGPMLNGGRTSWRIVQTYLAKDNENDQRLFEPHVNPEAEHWFKAEGDLERLSRILNKGAKGLNISFWTGLDFVGDYFKTKSGQEHLVSFDLIDLSMSLVKKGHIKYLYHHEEALWNKIFSEYMGRETMNRLIEENIIKGFIEL